MDAIVYQFNADVGEAVAQVAQGKVDYIREGDPALARARLWRVLPARDTA